MRTIDTFAGIAGLLLSALMALQLIAAPHGPHSAPGFAPALCADGAVHLAMGCESIHL